MIIEKPGKLRPWGKYDVPEHLFPVFHTVDLFIHALYNAALIIVLVYYQHVINTCVPYYRNIGMRYDGAHYKFITGLTLGKKIRFTHMIDKEHIVVKQNKMLRKIRDPVIIQFDHIGIERREIFRRYIIFMVYHEVIQL